MKHTEGPWRVSEWLEQDEESYHYEIISGNMWICKISPYLTGEYENAKLISKAPEMLEFLKDINEWHIAVSEHGKDRHFPLSTLRSLLKEIES